MQRDVGPDGAQVAARQRLMRNCTEATADELLVALESLAPVPEASDLRPPEAGLVMLRGRMGGDGRPFNLGEATVARAAVRLDTGETGFAYQLGRDLRKARAAAILDALAQTDSHGAAVERALAASRDRVAARRAEKAEQTAATRVNFFTLTRGGD